jgi:hypothetical protein
VRDGAAPANSTLFSQLQEVNGNATVGLSDCIISQISALMLLASLRNADRFLFVA